MNGNLSKLINLEQIFDKHKRGTEYQLSLHESLDLQTETQEIMGCVDLLFSNFYFENDLRKLENGEFAGLITSIYNPREAYYHVR